MTQQVVASNMGGIYDTTSCCVKYGRKTVKNYNYVSALEEISCTQSIFKIKKTKEII